MNMIKKLPVSSSLFCFVLLSLLAACNSNDDGPKGEFSSGVLITNEGTFGHGNGSVSYYNPATGETQQDLFGAKNNQKQLGDVVQSVTIDGDLAYIVVNNS